MHSVETCFLKEMDCTRRDAMFRLRHDTFARRLGWVQPDSSNAELDAFDAIDAARYVVASSDTGQVDACWRMLPTLGPNMLRDVFPMLVRGRPPAAPEVWELSRCAVATEREPPNGRPAHPQVGCGRLLRALMRESVDFARRNGIARYVTVTTPGIERLLREQGLHLRRAGPPRHIGLVQAVACYVEIDRTTAAALA